LKRPAYRSVLSCLSVTALSVAACSQAAPSKAGDDDDASGNATQGGSSGALSMNGGSGPAQGGSAGQSVGQGGTTGGSAGTPVIAGQGGTAAGTGGGSGGNVTAGTSTGAQGGAAGTPMVTGGASGAGAPSAGGAAGAAAGAAGSAGTPGTGDGSLGNGMMTGTGTSSERYETTEVGRNGVPYELITNGWGPGFQSHTVSWNGTSFIVQAMEGTRGSGGQPASYPSVFCGQYSVKEIPACGLPKAISEITTLKTGWRWNANGNTGAYNAAYDIWLGTDTGFGMYLMVWLRDPPSEQPAGSANMMFQGVTVGSLPGVWDIWNGTVNNRPIINWVRHEGMDSPEIEFDVMDIIKDAQMRGLTITGTKVNAIAVGFEIWSGPITNLESTDFYVDVK
jgi:hypothetical protein